MNERNYQLGNDESLTTAGIVNPERTTPLQPAAVEERNLQTRQEIPTHQNSAATATSSLFPDDAMNSFRARWEQIQTSFVDEPRQAVEQADNLVANTVKRIAEQFSTERALLERQWDSGNDVSTEDLRQALKRYRSFFNRLLAF